MRTASYALSRMAAWPQRMPRAYPLAPFIRRLIMPATLLTVILSSGCNTQVLLQTDFPTPLIEPLPVSVGLVVDAELASFQHVESIDRYGDFAIAIGPAQTRLFDRLGAGVFAAHQLLDSTAEIVPIGAQQEAAKNALPQLFLRPSISQFQFSIPQQTGSSYFEVWIRYQLEMLDSEGNEVGRWYLPAYGKASENDYGGKKAALMAAALSASRDAMAFFSLNVSRRDDAKRWLQGDPGVVKTAASNAPADAQTATDTSKEASQ